LEDDLVTVWMKEHHSTGDGAREKVEGYLRRWEVLSALQHNGRRLMHFKCESVEVLDLEDPFSCRRTKPVGASVKARWAVMRSHVWYPALPDDFDFSADVEVMWTLYDGYQQGRDRILPMAYTCLTRLEYSAGGRRADAARQYGIDKKEVLGRIGNLTANLGAGVEARKWEKGRNLRDPTNEERMWIEAAVRILRITFPRRSVHHTSFLWALCQEFVRSTTHRLVATSGVGLPFREISASSPRSSSRSRVAFES